MDNDNDNDFNYSYIYEYNFESNKFTKRNIIFKGENFMYFKPDYINDADINRFYSGEFLKNDKEIDYDEDENHE